MGQDKYILKSIFADGDGELPFNRGSLVSGKPSGGQLGTSLHLQVDAPDAGHFQRLHGATLKATDIEGRELELFGVRHGTGPNANDIIILSVASWKIVD